MNKVFYLPGFYFIANKEQRMILNSKNYVYSTHKTSQSTVFYTDIEWSKNAAPVIVEFSRDIELLIKSETHATKTTVLNFLISKTEL